MFKKFDGKKNRLELIEPEFVLGIGKVLSFGAEKYEAFNWQKGNSEEDQLRIKGAMLRHMMAYIGGEETDPETGISHLHHISANGMFLDYFDRNILKEGTEDNIEVPETTGDKEIHSIRYWLNDSNYEYIDTVDGITLIRNRDTSFDHYFSSYSNFFEWLTNEEYELYKKNGPN